MLPGPWAIWMLRGVAAGMAAVACLCWTPGATAAEPAPPAAAETTPTLAERDQLGARAEQLAAEGNLPEAVEVARQMLAVEVRLFGEANEAVAGSYGMIASYLERLERFPEAIDARTKQLEILTALHGADDWRAVDARNAIAFTQQKSKLTADARRELATADEKQLLAYQLHGQGKLADALAQARECLAIRQEVLGQQHPETARSLNNLGFLLQTTGDYAAARLHYERALAAYRKSLGEEHRHTATALNNLGFLLQATGDYAAARPYFEQALAIRTNVLGEDHPDAAEVMNNLGLLILYMGDAAAARPYLEQALTIRNKVLGDEHPHAAASLNSLGFLHKSMGDYAAARPYYEQALAIRTKTLGADHPATATSLNNLGSLLESMGDYAAARPCYEQAVAICRTALGEEHPDTAASLNNLGSLLKSMGDSAAARPYCEQALAITTKLMGEEHPDTATSLNNLAMLLNDSGDAAAARPYYEQALAIRRKVLGEAHPDTAVSLSSLGGLHASLGDYAAAKHCCEQALAIHRKVQGAEHLDVAKALDDLAIISAANEDWPAAIDGLVEAKRIKQRSLEKVFATATEVRMRAYLNTMAGDLDRILSMPLARLKREADGLTWALRRKAVVFEALCLSRTAQWLARENPEFAQQQAVLVAARKQLDDVTLRPPPGAAPAELAAQRALLQTQIAELEDRLQTAISGHLGHEWSLMTTIDSVRSRLPADAALVEVVKYAPFNARATGQEPKWSARRYVAFVLHADAARPVELVELGEAAAIDAAIAALGEHQQEVQRVGEFADWAALEQQYRELAAPLSATLFAPIAAKLAGVKQVYLSPDSQLHNLPFEALVDADGKYLAEQGYTFAYLASGRDLLRDADGPPGDGAYVFAAPNYDLGHGERFQLAERGAAPSQSLGVTAPDLLASAGPLGTRSADVRGLKWKVLPSMAPEGVEAAEHLTGASYGKVQSFSGDAALEEQFKRMVHPRLVVLVTHGFFLPDQPADRDALSGDDPATRSAFAQGAGLARLRAQENPLYRSGVVLAGANTLDDPTPAGVSVEDGWLTAEEISQLDLRGTDLVVLSACNTGRGQVGAGDAVAGLRSAFLFAGTQTLVGSLYEVPDRETRQLMQTFYAGLRESKGKLASLNAARLELIEQLRAEQGAAHPFFWASFVLVGAP